MRTKILHQDYVTAVSAGLRLLIVVLSLFSLTLVIQAQPAAIESRADQQQQEMRKAIALIQNHDYELARTYLDAVLISPFISNTQRSRGYYFRGFSYFSQRMFVSAAQDYARSLEFDPANKSTLSAVAHLYSQGLGTKKDPTIAFEYYLKAARAGHQFSQYQVGRAYLEGYGVTPELKKARYWLGTSAGIDTDESYAPAIVLLAATWREEPEPDIARAAALYKKAAKLGSTDALVGLAYMHLNGEFNEDEETGAATGNLELAADYFRQAAGAGSAAGQAGLGYLYETGKGLAPNSREASVWYGRAARAGNSFAQQRLGELRLKNPTLENSRTALDWFQKASLQGVLSAQNALAWLLATSKYPELRNGDQAVELARTIVGQNARPNYLDTLAAAQAETGDFDAAIATQTRAIEALDESQTGAADKYRERLSAYINRDPWRE